MHLLVITRKIDHDDPRVGFVSAWANELKKSLKFLTIIAWQESRPEADWENIRLDSYYFETKCPKCGAICDVE